jgi:hypothetical protein
MLLIKHVVHDPDLPGDVDHKVNKPYVKRKGAGAAAPTAPTAGPDTFMRDARSSASSHSQSTAARAASREVQQLNWF